MKLFCWREHEVHPYYKIGPLKVELLSMHPKTEVVVIHHVVIQRLLTFLSNDSSDRTYTTCPNAGMTARECLFATTYVARNVSEDAMLTLELASRISGLKSTERAIMLNAYAPGGHNAVHTDSVSWNHPHISCWQF